MHDANAEGFVCKNRYAAYAGGRAGQHFKFKFVATASFIVGSKPNKKAGDGHRSIAMYLLDGNRPHFMGTVGVSWARWESLTDIHSRVWSRLWKCVTSTAIPDPKEGKQQLEQADRDTISYVRGLNLEHGCTASDNRILVIANKSDQPTTVRISTLETALEGCTRSEVLLGDEHSVQLTSQTISAQVAPFGLSIIRLR